MTTVLLIVIAKIFMIAAWYMHLKFPGLKMYEAVFLSWLLAFFEYSLAIPAIRYGKEQFSIPEIQTMQIIFMLIAFIGFSMLILNVKMTHNHFIGFGFLMAGAAFIYNAEGFGS